MSETQNDHTTQIKVIDQKFFDFLSDKAANSQRKRSNFNLHPVLEDNVQRFFNAMEPGTYVRPHLHDDKDKWELFIILRGSAAAIIFNSNGIILERHILQPDSGPVAIEIPERTWHTIIALETGTILYESKRGPYTPSSDKDFASWAPNEGDADTDQFLNWFRHGEIGSIPPQRVQAS